MPTTSIPPIPYHLNEIPERGPSPPASPRPLSAALRLNFEATYPALLRTRRESLYVTNQPPKPIDFNTEESKEAMEVLRKLLGPIILRRVLKIRRRKRWPGESVMRAYTTDSIVHAIRSSDSIVANWPEEIIRLFAEEVKYFYLEPNEVIVYMHEWYVSCGIVVLLYGELTERTDLMQSPTSLTGGSYDHRYAAPSVFSDKVVLCKDASPSRISARGYADVAVLPARWVWDVINSYVLQHSGGSVLDTLKFTILPMCEEIMEETYFPTSLVLRRSWLWPLMASKDRIRLARLVTVRAFSIGDTLFCEGDRDPYMHIIRRGVIKAVVKDQPLLEFDSGASFGELSILFDEPRCCRAVATTMCEVYSLHRRHLMKYLRKKPQVYESMVKLALERREQWLESGKKRNIMGLSGLLAGVPCLSQTTEKMRNALALVAKTHVLPPKQTLFAKNTLCDHLFIIGRGTLMLGDEKDNQGFRSTTGFVGELCLHPHRWPTDIVTVTSVDGWSLSVSDIMEALNSIHGNAQAVDICRQGIDLYRAQHGPDSVIEENTESTPLTPNHKDPEQQGLHSKRLTLSYTDGIHKPTELPVAFIQEHIGIVTEFDWKKYSMEDKSADLLDDAGESERTSRGDRRKLEISIENELARRVGGLLSASEKKDSSAVDSDFSADIDDMQEMLVERVFLTPTERQPALLRQINRSKITIIFDNESEPVDDLSTEIPIAHDLTLPQYVVPSPVVYTLDGVTAYTDGNPLPTPEAAPLISPRTGLDFAATAMRRRSRTPEVLHCNTWQVTTQRSLEEMLSRTTKSRPQSGMMSFSRPVRPASGFSLRRSPPRAASAGGGNNRMSQSISFCSRASAIGTLTVSQTSENVSASAQANATSWTKPNKIDLSQQAKITASMFQSALDRFVKLDDQSYFQEMVRVCIPAQPEEEWFDGEVSTPKKKEGLMLLLVHVRRCEGLDINESITAPIVKVSTNTRILMRTPVMEDRDEPSWPIQSASFISFVHRDAEVHFTVCDAKDESQIAYSATLPSGVLRDNSGVGIRSLPLTAEELGLSDTSSDFGARIELCMMAVTAPSHNGFKSSFDDEEAENSSDDLSTVYLQVLSVEGLKHRIEAVVSVCVEVDGKSKEILRTEKAYPKSRTPSWPGETSFCVIKSDGIVSFDLYHRDAFLASFDTPVDTLVFGGTGIRVFPLVRAQGGPGEIYGNILVSILGLKAASGEEHAFDRPGKVLVVHVEGLTLTPDSDEFIPDPFVVVRGLNGEVILRTTLKFGTYDAKWSEEEASCFIMCPSLAGSTAIYRLEVYDNNESGKLGTAEMSVSTNGIKRSRMQFPVGQRGVLHIVAHAFQIQNVPRPSRPRKRSLPSESNENNFLLTIHVSGCDNLQGTGFDDFQIDPLVTVRTGRRRMVLAPIISGNTTPRWVYPKATIVVPVLPEILTHITLEVWDTNIELCDVLGVARISIGDLCRTGTHHFPLQPHKDQEFGRLQNLGTITVKTRFGRKNGKVISDGSSDLLLLGNSSGEGLLDSGLFQGSAESQLPISRVRVHISSCSAICTEVSTKIKVTMSCRQHVLLEVKKDLDRSGSVAWSLEEAQVVVDLRAIYGRALRLTVACNSEESVSEFVDVGEAVFPFSELTSLKPDVISVRSFSLIGAVSGDRRASTEEDTTGRRQSDGVAVDMPNITISLLAIEAGHSMGA